MSKLVPSSPHPPADFEPRVEWGSEPGDGAVEPSADLREALGMMRRNLWLILGVAFATTAVAAFAALNQPARYSASAAVRIADVRRSLTGGIEEQAMERFTGSMTDPVLSQIEVLRSRSLLGRAVDASGARLSPGNFPGTLIDQPAVLADAQPDTLVLRFDAQRFAVRGRAGSAEAPYGSPVEVGGVRFAITAHPGESSGTLLVTDREAAISQIQARLTARQRERTDIVDLRYEHGDPVTAQRTLSSVAEAFQTVNAERSRLASRRRRIFLEEQLQATDSMLALAQLDLSRFRERESGFSMRDRFVAQQQSLVTLDLRREELTAERNVYRGLLARLTSEGEANSAALRAIVSNPTLVSNPAIAQLNTQLLRYETARDSLMGGAYPLAATHPDAQRLESLLRTTATRIAETLRSHVANVDVRLAALTELRERHAAEILTMPDTEAQEVQLTRDVLTTQAIADQLRQEYQKARISEAVETGQVEILDPAGPARPLPSRRGLTILMGLVAGLVLGGSAAVVREQLNTSIRRRDEVERFLGIPSLAVVPRLGSARTRAIRLPGRNGSRPGPEPGSLSPDGTLVTALHPRSAGAEAFRTLRTNLIFSQAVRELRMIAVTSSGPAEGKSTTSANVATVFAQQGLRVLLVDCDLRRPRLHEIFSVQKEPGFTQHLLGYGTLEELTCSTSVENLHILPAGTLPPNPAELLGSPRAREVFQGLRDHYDVVVIDTPPVLLASDAAIIGSLVDGMLLVVRAGQTGRHAAEQAVRQLRTVGANVLGVVLNDPDAKIPTYDSSYGYGYGYGYGYHAYYGDETTPEVRKAVSSTSS